MTPKKILILDFGSQTTQLIGRRLRDLNTYCEIVPYNKLPENFDDVSGVILSGSPFSVYDPKAFRIDLSLIRGQIPLLGICYGAQSLVHQAGGSVEPSSTREYGSSALSILALEDPLFSDLETKSTVWMSHGDTITKLPEGFRSIATTETVVNAAFRIEGEETWGVQFHPEVYHTEEGIKLLRNFAEISGVLGNWTADAYIETTVIELRKTLQDDKVLMALSGGVDSSVAAVLLHRAIGDRLTCIFVDHGLLRFHEAAQVVEDYKELGLNIIPVNASELFYNALQGVTDPEQKRKIIGKLFIDVFDAEAQKIQDVKWLGQGTIYPDVIESLNITGMVIKSHHNVGGLPEKMKLRLVEPLRALFKDEVRRVGTALGMPKHLIDRHPFPGPGLGIRILGEITPRKVEILQKADDIYVRTLRSEGLYDKVWQAGAILLPVKSVGVMGDERTYEYTIALRAVTSIDAMSADWARLPFDFLARVSNEIINKVKGVNRVVYDISSKPPATIEWE